MVEQLGSRLANLNRIWSCCVTVSPCKNLLGENVLDRIFAAAAAQAEPQVLARAFAAQQQTPRPDPPTHDPDDDGA